MHPSPDDYAYDLDQALSAIVAVRCSVPPEAFTAESLGTERAGHGVLIRRDGLVLTIGYLVTEAEAVWLTLASGQVVQGHVLGYDQETGFGLVQALARIETPALELGASGSIRVGEEVVLAGAGGRRHAVSQRIVARQEFAGYWEYVLDEAIFTAPSHPNWGGTGLIGPTGELLGIGSLQVQHPRQGQAPIDINMVVPIDLLKPILDDLTTIGRARRPSRPWLGILATEVGERVVIAGLTKRGPANRSSLKTGDMVMEVAGQAVQGLAPFFRMIWSLGPAGVGVPLRVNRNGQMVDLVVDSGDRRNFLKGPVVH